MPPPGLREGDPNFFTSFSDYTFNASLTVVENFKKLSLKRGWRVGSKTWRACWRACFKRSYTEDQDPFKPSPDDGRWDFFAGFPDYLVSRNASVIQNFKKLSLKRGWAVNSKAWRRNWRACFGHACNEDQNPLTGNADFNFFTTFPDYRVDRTASVLENVKRLSRRRHWGHGSKLWRRQWRACFGRAYTVHGNPFSDSSDSDDISNDSSSESGSDSSSDATTSSSSSSSSSSSGVRVANSEPSRRPALEEDFARSFGREGGKLENWQRLCRIVGLDVGTSITQCEKILGVPEVMINLVNLVKYMRGDAKLIEFGSWGEFQRYTRCKPNRFSRQEAKDNGFLRGLLRKL